MAYRRMRSLGVLLAILAALSTVPAMGADTLDAIRARHKLIVGIDLGLPPYGMRDSALLPTGSDVDAARLLADDLAVALEVIPVTAANRVALLQARKVDVVMASFVVTAARRKLVDFSMPYGIVSIVCAAPEPVAIAGAGDLAGKTVAVARGSSGDAEATRLAEADPRIEIVRVEDDMALVTALAAGRQSVAITTPADVRDAVGRGAKLVPKFVIRADAYAVGIRKGDARLEAAVDAWIGKDLADGKLRRIFARWHGTELPAVMPRP